MEALREGYRILFSRGPPLSDQPLPMPSYSPSSIRGKALEKEFLDLLHKRAIEQAPQTPGFYSRLFVVQKDSGSWRPIIDLSTLNTFIVSLPDVNSSDHGPDSSANGQNGGRHDPLSPFSLGNVACLHASKLTVATKPLAQPSL